MRIAATVVDGNKDVGLEAPSCGLSSIEGRVNVEVGDILDAFLVEVSRVSTADPISLMMKRSLFRSSTKKEKDFLGLSCVSVINGPFIDGRTTGIKPARSGFTIHCLDPLGYIRPYPRTGLRIGKMDRTLNSRDQETREMVYLWAEKWLSRSRQSLRWVLRLRLDRRGLSGLGDSPGPLDDLMIPGVLFSLCYA
ncbi:hypothetical protein LOK49_LG11G02826 [Camellia lanceoleosa]|uniref:Uncharacterized protein n=1 Tax=Camellia lanceoleosa TaxID=1840588 RepID=A0ACC0FX25_9ERIC|nr:hypothetical protein LOK49_LG11G02826 [Camellia lanceoleosa]